MKIRIIGCSGTGKTTLARQLSKEFDIPQHDLDDLQWDNTAGGYGQKTPVEKRDAMLCDILLENDWIIEGVYYSWCEDTFRQADRIYVLDVPPHIYKKRIVRRFLRRKLGLEPGKKETLSSLRALLRWTDTFQQKNMPEIDRLIASCSAEVIRLSDTGEMSYPVNDMRRIVLDEGK